MLSILDSMICVRCEEILEEAVRLADGKRACRACTCHSCGLAVSRFIDIDNNDQQLCVGCARHVLAAPEPCAICAAPAESNTSDFCAQHRYWFVCDACDHPSGGTRHTGTLGQPMCATCYSITREVAP